MVGWVAVTVGAVCITLQTTLVVAAGVHILLG